MNKSIFICPNCSNKLVFEISMKNLFGAVEKKISDNTVFMRFAGLYMNDAKPEITRIVCRTCDIEVDIEEVNIICPFTGEQLNQSEFVIVNVVKRVDGLVAKRKNFIVAKDADEELQRLHNDYVNYGYDFEVEEFSIGIEEGLLNVQE